jgi:ribosomal-protein-alanine N-acetyltransferase
MVEIGLWLKKSAHGNGYGTETVKTLIEFAEAHLDFEYLLYPVDKDNWISKKIPEKLGFIPTRTYEKKKSGTENLHIIEFRKKK